MALSEGKEHRMKDVRVGEEIRVGWSNGAGYSVYKIIDGTGAFGDFSAGPHELQRVADYEYGDENGNAVKMEG